MDTIELTLAIPTSEHDRYVARLEACATGFVQDDAELRAYVPADQWAGVDCEALDARLAADGYPNALTLRPLAAKNWNAVWEDTLSPVRAGPFLVCPTAAEVPSTQNEATVLRIDPEMSFGTGHHATTRLALRLLSETIAANDRVLDMGTGTGILAIAACRSGAADALGVDTNPDAVRNARDNAHRNEVADCVAVREGSLEQVPDTHYDVVAANITRHVMLNLLPDLADRLAPRDTLLLSGILQPQRDDILDAATAHDLHPNAEIMEDGWWAASLSLCPRR
ncbi:MAG: 50S ribosomal protein L11 methyltransferase [Bacteroidetes bacterium QS_1_63_11]|nr:MAG: 50S ribosomal protein L11 methyltransferase [Bacteroidetes bacterium QS_1_63_11]